MHALTIIILRNIFLTATPTTARRPRTEYIRNRATSLPNLYVSCYKKTYTELIEYLTLNILPLLRQDVLRVRCDEYFHSIDERAGSFHVVGGLFHGDLDQFLIVDSLACFEDFVQDF